eukprot:COSAG04_NODE_313_length_17126_cov_17.159922_10_plen_329_part_00
MRAGRTDDCSSWTLRGGQREEVGQTTESQNRKTTEDVESKKVHGDRQTEGRGGGHTHAALPHDGDAARHRAGRPATGRASSAAAHKHAARHQPQQPLGGGTAAPIQLAGSRAPSGRHQRRAAHQLAGWEPEPEPEPDAAVVVAVQHPCAVALLVVGSAQSGCWTSPHTTLPHVSMNAVVTSTPHRFATSPGLAISRTSSSPPANATARAQSVSSARRNARVNYSLAFGAVATGSMKANDAATVPGTSRCIGLISIDCDSDASTGMAIVQVAVLLVNSLQARDRPSCQPDRKSPAGCTKGAVRREGDHERDNQHRERRGQVLEHHQLVT